MESSTNMFDGTNWIFAIIIFFIVAGFLSGNGLGFGNNSGGQITNDFLYTNLANDVRANGTAINTVDRDVLENRYQNSLQTNTLQNQASINALQMQNNLDSCCCELKTAIHSEGEATRALITQNRISDLEKDLVNANTIISNATQTSNILGQLGTWRANPSYPYYGTYGTYGYTGTTIY